MVIFGYVEVGVGMCRYVDVRVCNYLLNSAACTRHPHKQ